MKRRKNFKGTEAWEKVNLKGVFCSNGKVSEVNWNSKCYQNIYVLTIIRQVKYPLPPLVLRVFGLRTDAEATQWFSEYCIDWIGEMSVWSLERQYLYDGLRVEAAFALGLVHLFCLEGGLHGNHKNSAFPMCSTYSRPKFLLCCWKKIFSV